MAAAKVAPGPQPPLPLHAQHPIPLSPWLPLSFPTQLPNLPLFGQLSLDNLQVPPSDPQPYGCQPAGALLLFAPRTPSVWAP